MSQVSSDNFSESLCPGKHIEKKENLLLTEIKKMSEKVDELSCLCEEVSKLKELHDTCMKSWASPASSLLPQFDNYRYSDGNVWWRPHRDCESADIVIIVFVWIYTP